MGNVDRVLYLEGSWNLLREMKDIGSLLGAIQPPYYEVDYTGVSYTIYDIIKQVLVAAGLGLYALGAEDDSIIDTLQPDFVVNAPGPIEDAATVIYRLMNMTKTFCRVETEATSATSTPSDVSTTTESASTQNLYSRNSFWTAGRYWVFYSDGTNLVFRSSTDGSTWSSASSSLGAAIHEFYAITYDERTGKVAYTRVVQNVTDYVYWRQGSPQTDGTITWDAAEQTVRTDDTDAIFNPNCCFDSNGVAWVTWSEAYKPYVSKNANTDGTWSDATNFPHELSASGRPYTAPIPLLDGDVYVVCIATGDPSTIKGFKWSTTWGNEETIGSAIVASQNAWSAVGIGDTVHLCYSPGSKVIYHCKRDPTAGTWAEAAIFTHSEQTYPQLSIVNGVLYLIYDTPTSLEINYRKYDGTSWDAAGTVLFDTTNAQGYAAQRMVASYQASDDKVSVIWMTDGSSPYTIRFGVRSVHNASFRIKYPSGYGSYDYTYVSDKPAATDHQFKEFEWRDQIKIPNVVYAIANQSADGSWDNYKVGKYELAILTNNQYPKIVEYYVASTLTTQANADNRAAAIALRRQMEAPLGRLVVPHNCGQELYDWIKIRDKRPTGTYVDYPPTRWGNEAIVGSLTHVYDPENGRYDLEITINGIVSSAPMDATIPVRPIEEEIPPLAKQAREAVQAAKEAIEIGKREGIRFPADEERLYFPTVVPLTEYGQERLSKQMEAMIEEYGMEGLKERMLKASEGFNQEERQRLSGGKTEEFTKAYEENLARLKRAERYGI